jgi:hypothetical protein
MTRLPRNLPEGGKLIGDSAYTGYLLEDMLRDNGIGLPAARKTNTKRQHNPSTEILSLSGENALKLPSPIWPNLCLNLFMPSLPRGF